MPERYDDWGNPVRPTGPGMQETGIRGFVKPLLRSFREYRAVFLWALAAIGLYLFFGTGPPREPPVDWKLFAYTSYATDNHHICNSVMMFETLHRLGSKADRVLMYPREWDSSSPKDRNFELLRLAEANYNVKLQPVTVISHSGDAKPGTLDNPSTWDTSITKLRAFELDEYERVLHIDGDVLLRQHMDELFLLPKTQMAMPRAYWEPSTTGHHRLTSNLMLLEPNRLEFQNMVKILSKWKTNPEYRVGKKYEMDLLNHRFGDSAMVLPHRPYYLRSSEFRSDNHDTYLGITSGPSGHLPARMKWDAHRVLEEAKVIQFSDAPLPKPWIMWPMEGLREMQPDCGGSHLACPERKAWKSLYDDFRKRRKAICRILSVPAPRWDDIKNGTETA